jgi:hypothetical protein|tara:strand:+ start:831 stop:1355 length:525 start_codon:yes stop_codon:yes gene_type:complete
MVLPYTPEQMSYAFEAAWNLLKQEQEEDEGEPVTHMGRRGRARAERRAERRRMRPGGNSPKMQDTVAARQAGQRTPNDSMYMATHTPHISGQAHNLKRLPFRLDEHEYRTPDMTMGRMRMPTTGPVTVPGQAEDMGGPMSNEEFEGLMAFMTRRQPGLDTPNTMQLGDFPVRQR